MNRNIVHIDLDTFFVSCERLMNPELKGKPVLVGGTSGRGVVAACSYEAREYGVHSAMPMRMAQQLCPHAIVVRGNSSIYSKFSDTITEMISEQAPLYEKSSIDEFYIDVTGMDKFYGSYKWAQELRDRIIKETHLPISFGLSTNKTVSKVATNEVKPNNHVKIEEGKEKSFLAPLVVKKIPMVGDQTYKMLLSMGIKYVKTIQEMPVELMEKVMGKNGVALWKKAQGIDNSLVEPYSERKSISSSLTFEKDTIDVVALKNLLLSMTEKLAFQLRNSNKLTSCVTVTVRYSDFDTRTRQKRIYYTSLDHTLIETVMELFDQLYSRRVLVRLVGVRFSHLIGGSYQMRLFEDNTKLIRLYQQMDKMRNRFGQDAIFRASTLGIRGVGQAINPFNGLSPGVPAHRRM
ncbi:DNA polymerase IV [Maribellus sp. CM-23]|uniref:DNA polymerase IV n=1 Tax=Maribellus sp. CM-23 TaxID=2781026 RepID=UPI001F3B0991|nr:DNA polymerase IV [Maribellus sp. CM-23]MCE4566887.1 DNA polymerase IV [Maribellus sp. CM-23]